MAAAQASDAPDLSGDPRYHALWVKLRELNLKDPLMGHVKITDLHKSKFKVHEGTMSSVELPYTVPMTAGSYSKPLLLALNENFCVIKALEPNTVIEVNNKEMCAMLPEGVLPLSYLGRYVLPKGKDLATMTESEKETLLRRLDSHYYKKRLESREYQHNRNNP